MGDETGITWADRTLNPWTGCTKVSKGCDNCYAETLRARFGHGNEWGPAGVRTRTSAANWDKARRWNRQAAAESSMFPTGRRPRVFCASLADVFETRPELGPWRDELFELIAETPNLDWLLLTKRPKFAAEYLSRWAAEVMVDRPLNVWAGVSVETPRELYRVDAIRRVPAPVRFISAGPLLADLGEVNLDGIGWVICEGESGGKAARPMNPDWARSLRDQCQAAGVPFHFKQWGETGEHGIRVGVKNAGRLLDGVLWDEFPEVVR